MSVCRSPHPALLRSPHPHNIPRVQLGSRCGGGGHTRPHHATHTGHLISTYWPLPTNQATSKLEGHQLSAQIRALWVPGGEWLEVQAAGEEVQGAQPGRFLGSLMTLNVTWTQPGPSRADNSQLTRIPPSTPSCPKAFLLLLISTQTAQPSLTSSRKPS